MKTVMISEWLSYCIQAQMALNWLAKGARGLFLRRECVIVAAELLLWKAGCVMWRWNSVRTGHTMEPPALHAGGCWGCVVCVCWGGNDRQLKTEKWRYVREGGHTEDLVRKSLRLFIQWRFSHVVKRCSCTVFIFNTWSEKQCMSWISYNLSWHPVLGNNNNTQFINNTTTVVFCYLLK